MTEELQKRPELSREEEKAYQRHLEKADPELALALEANLFNLFLQGNTCRQIQAINPALKLGQIVSARIRGEWDRRLAEHRAELLDGVRQRVQQTTFESVNFVCDLLASANVLWGTKLKKFQQTGDPNELGDLSIASFKQYKETLELLIKATGQDKPQQAQVNVVASGNVSVQPVVGSPKDMDSDQAEQILKILSKNNNGT